MNSCLSFANLEPQSQFKQVNDIYVRAKLIKILEEKQRKTFHHLGFGNGVLNIPPKARATKEKNITDKLDFIKN